MDREAWRRAFGMDWPFDSDGSKTRRHKCQAIKAGCVWRRADRSDGCADHEQEWEQEWDLLWKGPTL